MSKVIGACLSVPVGGRAFATSVCFPEWMRAYVPAGTSDPWEWDWRVSACLAISVLELYSETRTWPIHSAAQNPTALMLLPNITSSDLLNCFSLVVLAVSPLLTGTGLHNLLSKHAFQSSAWTAVMALLLRVSWVGSESVPGKGLQNRRLVSLLFVYGGFGKRGSSITAWIFPLKLADCL